MLHVCSINCKLIIYSIINNTFVLKNSERERERESNLSVHPLLLFCQSILLSNSWTSTINNNAQTAESYILKIKETLLEVADIKQRRNIDH